MAIRSGKPSGRSGDQTRKCGLRTRSPHASGPSARMRYGPVPGSGSSRLGRWRPASTMRDLELVQEFGVGSAQMDGHGSSRGVGLDPLGRDRSVWDCIAPPPRSRGAAGWRGHWQHARSSDARTSAGGRAPRWRSGGSAAVGSRTSVHPGWVPAGSGPGRGQRPAGRTARATVGDETVVERGAARSAGRAGGAARFIRPARGTRSVPPRCVAASATAAVHTSPSTTASAAGLLLNGVSST